MKFPTSYEWGYTPISTVITPSYTCIRPFIGVITPFIAGRGPPCM